MKKDNKNSYSILARSCCLLSEFFRLVCKSLSEGELLVKKKGNRRRLHKGVGSTEVWP